MVRAPLEAILSRNRLHFRFANRYTAKPPSRRNSHFGVSSIARTVTPVCRSFLRKRRNEVFEGPSIICAPWRGHCDCRRFLDGFVPRMLHSRTLGPLGARTLRQSSCAFCCASSCTGLGGLKISVSVLNPSKNAVIATRIGCLARIRRWQKNGN